MALALRSHTSPHIWAVGSQGVTAFYPMAAIRSTRAGAEKLHPLSLVFFADAERFESARLAWRTRVVDRYIDRFVELVPCAEEAGEIRHVNTRFLGEVLREIGFVARDEPALSASGLTSEQAVLEVDALPWDGMRTP